MDSESPYYPGYEGWEHFDALPSDIKQAHHTVWTGPIFTEGYGNNRNRYNSVNDRVSHQDATAIADLDGGRMTLWSGELCEADQYGVAIFDSRDNYVRRL